MNAVIGETRVDSHISFLVVNAENSREFAVKGNNGGVEDRIACGKQVARDDGVCVIAPYNVFAACRAVLPRHIGDTYPVYDF